MSLLADGTGVAFDSDVLPVDSGGCIEGVVSIFSGCTDGFGVTSDGYRERSSGERRNLIIRLFLAVFNVDLVVVVVVDMAGDDGMCGRCAGDVLAKALVVCSMQSLGLRRTAPYVFSIAWLRPPDRSLVGGHLRYIRHPPLLA